MCNQQIDYEKKYKRSKLLNMVLISIIIGALIGGSFTFGLIGNGVSLNPNPVNADKLESINSQYESPVVKVAEDVLPSIVMIKSKQRVNNFFMSESVDRGTGSGIIYKTDGHIITNQHVIDGATEIEVTLHDGKVYDARILGQDSKTDLAVLKIEGDGFPAATLGDSDNIKVGELAVAIGNPMGEKFSGSVTSGIISALDRSLDVGTNKLKLIQTDAAINPGNSGGALVNKHGKVIGINSVKLTSPDVEGMGFAIPINDAMPIINELAENGYIERPWIGVSISDVTEQIAEKYDVPVGVYIANVTLNSPAAKVGLRVNDIITEIDGKRVKTLEELSKTMEEYKPNDIAKIKIYRDKEYKTVELKLGVMPQNIN